MSDHIPATIYCYGFNLKRFSIPYRAALINFCAFADEVNVATIKDEDDSPVLLHELAKELPNLRVIETDIFIENNNRFDGQLKTAAMRAASHPIRIIADLDETFVLSQKPIWQNLYINLLAHHLIDGWMIPTLDCWGSPKRLRADHHIGQKMRIHKDTVVERGVMKSAERPGGLIDTSVSDTTEALTKNGNLARFASPMQFQLIPTFSRFLLGQPYVIHHGYESLEARAKINGEFWKKHWEHRSGHKENVIIDEKELKKIPTVEHGLPLE